MSDREKQVQVGAFRVGQAAAWCGYTLSEKECREVAAHVVDGLTDLASRASGSAAADDGSGAQTPREARIFLDGLDEGQKDQARKDRDLIERLVEAMDSIQTECEEEHVECIKSEREEARLWLASVGPVADDGEGSWSELADRLIPASVDAERERLTVNPEPLEVRPLPTCRKCGKRAPWCSCGAMDYDEPAATDVAADSPYDAMSREELRAEVTRLSETVVALSSSSAPSEPDWKALAPEIVTAYGQTQGGVVRGWDVAAIRFTLGYLANACGSQEQDGS